VRWLGGRMVPARTGATVVRQEIEFPTEWTMVDEGTNLKEGSQEAGTDSQAGAEKVEAPLAAQAHA
jgi:hypothetical protein